ncbi:hypothetical protein [Mesorhizobium sp. LNHC221B00]|uniref:hypothetical protein n=1 Tax=Mesorhizobium sp. LNHC221B00 TaxID=1287233 RepID=UPI0012EC6C85|nr:hypothetical protein [Mesorhizobium sp. LNHC221B00]
MQKDFSPINRQQLLDRQREAAASAESKKLMTRIYRLTSDGRQWPPAQKDGLFVLGDPSARNVKHQKKNEVLVPTEEEAIRLILKGFPIRIETKTRPSLVRRNLFVDGKRVS